MSDLTQQALTALADAGLGNESAAEAFVLGYQAGYDAAWLHAAKKALAAVNAMKTKEQQ